MPPPSSSEAVTSHENVDSHSSIEEPSIKTGESVSFPIPSPPNDERMSILETENSFIMNELAKTIEKSNNELEKAEHLDIESNSFCVTASPIASNQNACNSSASFMNPIPETEKEEDDSEIVKGFTLLKGDF
jgi:hypothetical protein